MIITYMLQYKFEPDVEWQYDMISEKLISQPSYTELEGMYFTGTFDDSSKYRPLEVTVELVR